MPRIVNCFQHRRHYSMKSFVFRGSNILIPCIRYYRAEFQFRDNDATYAEPAERLFLSSGTVFAIWINNSRQALK